MVFVVSVGADTYGRVKKVANTAVVTKFFAISGIPLYPMESVYLVTDGLTLPLAAIDKTSVRIAYVRAFFGALLVFSSMWLLVSFFARHNPMDDFQRIVFTGSSIAFGLAIVGGPLTYAVPFESRRERDIRRCCREFIGLAMDPALVRPDDANYLGKVAMTSRVDGDDRRNELLRQLVETRVEISRNSALDDLETKTDDLLRQLRDDGLPTC